MSDSFLAQLEQRTQQVKITLANLEAERTRIEGLISQLQPFVPHYDALLSAERTLQEAHVQIDEPQPASMPPASGGGYQPPAPQPAESSSWGSYQS